MLRQSFRYSYSAAETDHCLVGVGEQGVSIGDRIRQMMVGLHPPPDGKRWSSLLIEFIAKRLELIRKDLEALIGLRSKGFSQREASTPDWGNSRGSGLGCSLGMARLWKSRSHGEGRGKVMRGALQGKTGARQIVQSCDCISRAAGKPREAFKKWCMMFRNWNHSDCHLENGFSG